MALLFWLRVPVVIAARELKLDPKTVRRHYNLIRQGIVRTEGWGTQVNDGTAILSLLIGVGTDDKILVITSVPEVGNLFGYVWIYGAVLRCQEPLADIFCRVYLEESAFQQGTPSWTKKFDKLVSIARSLGRMTTARHGQSRQMLLNEIAFRFNHRSDPGVSAIIYSFFKND